MFEKGNGAPFDFGRANSRGMNDVKIRVWIAFQFVTQLGLAVRQIRSRGDQMRFVSRWRNQSERSDPVQRSYFEPISATMEAISKPIRSCASPVAAPMCGESEMPAWRIRSRRGLGSPTNTSTPAPET